MREGEKQKRVKEELPFQNSDCLKVQPHQPPAPDNPLLCFPPATPLLSPDRPLSQKDQSPFIPGRKTDRTRSVSTRVRGWRERKDSSARSECVGTPSRGTRVETGPVTPHEDFGVHRDWTHCRRGVPHNTGSGTKYSNSIRRRRRRNTDANPQRGP